MPAKLEDLMDGDGRWIYAAVAAKDPALDLLCWTGLHMEILSSKMYVEEPDACSIIFQALNRGQALGLKTPEITALAAVASACGKEMENAVTGTVLFEAVQRKVRHKLAEYADDTESISLFSFCCQHGCIAASQLIQ